MRYRDLILRAASKAKKVAFSQSSAEEINWFLELLAQAGIQVPKGTPLFERLLREARASEQLVGPDIAVARLKKLYEEIASAARAELRKAALRFRALAQDEWKFAWEFIRELASAMDLKWHPRLKPGAGASEVTSMWEIITTKIPIQELIERLEEASLLRSPEVLALVWQPELAEPKVASLALVKALLSAEPYLERIVRLGAEMPTVLTAFTDPTLRVLYPPEGYPEELPRLEAEVEKYLFYPPGKAPGNLLRLLSWLKPATDSVTTIRQKGREFCVCTAWFAGYTQEGEPLFVTAGHCFSVPVGAELQDAKAIGEDLPAEVDIPGLGRVEGRLSAFVFDEHDLDVAVVKLPRELKPAIQKRMQPLPLASEFALPQAGISGYHREVEIPEPGPAETPVIGHKARPGYSGAPWLRDGKVVALGIGGAGTQIWLAPLDAIGAALELAGLHYPALPRRFTPPPSRKPEE